MTKESKFYEIGQNNSGGSFVVDDKLCHKLVIEAFSEKEALDKAEDMGVYFDGCEDGRDCPCCGDRWYRSADEIKIEVYIKEGYTASTYKIGTKEESEKYWNSKYEKYPILEKPFWKKTNYGSEEYVGKLEVKSLEQYLQYRADEYGWTKPDMRIFYLNGIVKEIFKRG